MTTKMTGLQAAERVRNDLETSGLPRKSKLNGGEITGWTSAMGCTGFSIRTNGPGITWHLVVTGIPHLEYQEDQDGLHRPVNPDSLNDRIAKIFKDWGLTVHDTRCMGFATAWDFDVHYEVTTNRPDWLSSSNHDI